MSIKYSQQFYTPYLGYTIAYKYEKFILEIDAKGTFFATAKAKDDHLDRGLTGSIEKYKNNIKNLTASIKAGYEG